MSVQRPPLDERVVRAVDAQTTDRQPDAVREGTIIRQLTHRTRDDDRGGWDTVVGSEQIRPAIQEALEQGRIEAVETDDGVRYRLADSALAES